MSAVDQPNPAVTITWDERWREWLPECRRCLWVGSYWPEYDNALAVAEAERHVCPSGYETDRYE